MSLRNPWAIAFLTGIGIFVTFVLRLNLSPVAPVIAKEFHLTDWQLGLLLSGFLWVYTFLQPVAGWATDRWGAKFSMLLGIAATSIITIMTGFANSFLALFTLRVALGITQAPNFVSGAKVTSSRWFTKDQRARATSIWISGGRLGPVFAFPIAAWFAVIYGWQSAFYVTGLLGLVWCVAWFFGFRNDPEDTGPKQEVVHRIRVRESLPVILSPLGLGLAVASFGQGYVAYYLNLWLPTYLVRQQGFKILNAGIFATLPLLAAVVTLILVGGFLSDYLVKKGASPVGLRRKLFTVGMTIAAIMLVATAYAPDPYTALTALCLAGAALGFSTPSLWVALVEATPKELTGTMGGVQNFGGNIAGIVVAVLTGYILDITKSFFLALLAGSAAALIGAIAAALFVKPSIQQTLDSGDRSNRA
jgi:ACS family D-galactonate transporter-like MFS transporter